MRCRRQACRKQSGRRIVFMFSLFSLLRSRNFSQKPPDSILLATGLPVYLHQIPAAARGRLVEWSGGATGLDQWLPAYQPFRASWQMATRSCPRFLRPLYSFRTAGFTQYGWKPALSSCALPTPFGASFDAGAAVHPFLAISYPGVWNGGCTHRPLVQHGLSSPHLQSLLRPDPPV